MQITKNGLTEWLRTEYEAHLRSGLYDRAVSYAHVLEVIESGRFKVAGRWPSNMQHDEKMERFVDEFEREIGFEPRQPVGD